MSASLVGSEMCIRDSARTPWARLRPASADRGTTARSCSRRTTSRPWSVSYTHLTLPTICSV
eukprot:4372765-Alexandrium_andersonii.AAC.1